jgi:hypothetical protein
MDYSKDLEINKHSLDNELLTQAQKMLRYSSEHAQAMYNRDRAKQSLDIVKANLDASIRAELTSAGAKFTEAVVDGKIRTAPTYIEAQEKYQKAEHEVQVLLGAVMAMNARRSMLENLVKLFLSGYWSEPHVAGGQGMKEAASQASTEQAILRSQEMPPQEPAPEVVDKPFARPMPQVPPKAYPAPAPLPRRPTPKAE